MAITGFMPAELANIGPDWKSSVPHTLDSTQRISYQAPHQPAPLSNNTVRFGCSADDRHRLLVGIGKLYSSVNDCSHNLASIYLAMDEDVFNLSSDVVSSQCFQEEVNCEPSYDLRPILQ